MRVPGNEVGAYEETLIYRDCNSLANGLKDKCSISLEFCSPSCCQCIHFLSFDCNSRIREDLRLISGADLGGGCRGCAPPPPPLRWSFPRLIYCLSLRLSNHRLAIETGRYMRPCQKPNERICPLCRREAEDEKHFLVSCPVYEEKRKSQFECLYKEFKIPIKEMSTENIFLLLLNPPSNNVDLQKLVAKHIYNCHEIRQKKKKPLVNHQLTLENCQL